jgi:hypothetical protein
MRDAFRLLGSAGLLLSLGACAGPEGAQSTPPLAQLTDGAECVAQANGVEQVYRWRAGQRRLQLTTLSSSMQGLKLSTFVYQLGDQDRLLSREQLIDGVAEWRHIYTLDDRGNPLTLVYESQGSLASMSAYNNSYEGDRLMTVEQSSGPGTPVSFRFSYEYDAQGRRNYERIDFPAYGVRPPQETWTTFDGDGRLESVREIHLHGEKGLTTYSHDDAGRMLGSVTDGGPYVGDTDGRPDVTVSWSYSPTGRITRVLTQGGLSDVSTERDGRYEKTFGLGCEAFQARFPSIFRLPAALVFYPL